MWLIVLSDQLPIVALVGLYPTNEANRAQAHQKAPVLPRALFVSKPMRYCRRFLAGIPHLLVDDPRVPHPSATHPGSPPGAFDLHVLGTPPAFILSQDQTRHPMFYFSHELMCEDALSCAIQAAKSSCLACSQIVLSSADFAEESSVLTGTVQEQKTPNAFQFQFCFPLFSC